jgi:hypothetical protein
VQLESLIWQDRETLFALLSDRSTEIDGERIRAYWDAVAEETPRDRVRLTRITNEYAEVGVRAVPLGGDGVANSSRPSSGTGYG